MKASELFVKALENEGVEYIFGIPGEENLDFLDSLRHSKIKLIITRHEQSAGFMAATYGRLTGKPGVCLSTLGPGATNFTTAAAFAQLGAMPMLMITGQKPIKKSKQGDFQIVDIVDLFQPVTKYTHQIVNGEKIPSQVREAFRLAQEERPGAVHLELPEDIAEEETTSPVFEVVGHRMPDAPTLAILEAAEMIKKAKNPLILIGAGANRKRTSQALNALVETSGIPFFTTQMGKGVLDERNPAYIGTAALSSDDFVHCAISRADLIINVGHDIVEKPPFFMEHGGAKIIHVNFSPANVDEVYFPQLNVVGDIASSVIGITKEISGSTNWDFSYFRKVRENFEEHLREYAEDTRFPVLPQRFVHLLRQELPEDGIVALDNGMYKIWFARNYKTYQPNTLLLDNALATMGAGLPSAIAAKIVHPEKKVVAVCGDGGFMMNSQDLETAVRLKLDLVIIILNDGAFGMIKWKQKQEGFEDFGLDLKNPDFVKYAESYGVNGYRPESDSDLKNILSKSLNSEGIHLIDVSVDYSLDNEILDVELKEKTCNL